MPCVKRQWRAKIQLEEEKEYEENNGVTTAYGAFLLQHNVTALSVAARAIVRTYFGVSSNSGQLLYLFKQHLHCTNWRQLSPNNLLSVCQLP